MKIKEVIVVEAKQAALPQPSVVKQQQRVGKVLAQMAASDAKQQEPTEMDKVLAMRRYADLRKQTDKAYAVRLRSQLANAKRYEK